MGSYYLKKADEPLIKFDLKRNMYNEFSIDILWIETDNPNIPEKIVNNVTLLNWLNSRIIPRNRTYIHEILSSQGIEPNDIEGIINICLGLSVNDIYWVVPEDFTGLFKDYNLYDNSFSEALSLVAFTGYSHTIKDLSPSPELTTDGMLPKAWRRINNELILYKGGTNADLYSNAGKEPYNEFYAMQVADALGVSHVRYDLEKWKGILASKCKNFTTKQFSYVPMLKILDNLNLSSLVAKIEEIKCMDKFKDMILVDSIILNEDRHYGNFGLIKSNDTNQYIDFAPLFDHGVSLFYYISDNDLKNKELYQQYIDTHSYSKLGNSYDQLVAWFLDKNDIKKLNRLINFKFEKHPHYNLSDERLAILETYIHTRAREIINIIQHGLPQKKDIQKRRTLDITSTFLGINYSYKGDDYLGGECILSKNNKIIDKIIIKNENLKDVDAITYIEDIIEQRYGKEPLMNIKDRISSAKEKQSQLPSPTQSLDKDLTKGKSH